MNDVEINPYYESLITGNDHQQHFQAQQKHSTIMTHISETSGETVGNLTGEYYFDPQAGRYVNDTKDDYSEAVQAERNLNVVDMPVGLSGLKNRKRPLDRARSVLGWQSMTGVVDTPEVLQELQRIGAEEYSDSGWVQMGRGVAGMLDFGLADMTGDTARFLDKVRDEMTSAGLEFESKYQTLDSGEVVEFTPELYLETVKKTNPIAAIALDEAGIDAESIAGVNTYVDAVEAVSTKLWEHGQQKRASQQELSASEGVLKMFHNLGNMVLQDPDMSAEIGLELGGVAVTSVFTGGAAAAAWYVTRFAQLGNRARTAAQMANRGRRLNRLQTASEGMQRVANAVGVANEFKPGLSFFGNLAEAGMKRLGASGGFANTRLGQNSAWLAGQLVDGYIGGYGARIRSNAFLQQEAMEMYGNDQNIDLFRNAHLEGMYGMGFSALLGGVFRYGGRVALNRFRTDKRAIGYDDYYTQASENAKSEEAQLQLIYGADAPAGVKAWQARRRAQNEAYHRLAYMTGERATPEKLSEASGLIGNLNQGLPLMAFSDALRRSAQRRKGVDADGNPVEPVTDLNTVAIDILNDPLFIRDLELQQRLSPAEVQEKVRMQRAHIARGAAARGVDPELDAKMAQGLSLEEATRALQAERTAETETRISEVEQELEAATTEADSRSTAKAEAEKAKVEEDNKAAQQRAEEAEAKAKEARKRADELNEAEEPDAPVSKEAQEVETKRNELVDRMENEDLDPKEEGDLRDEVRELDAKLEKLESDSPRVRKPKEGVDADEAADAIERANEAEAEAKAARTTATNTQKAADNFDIKEAQTRASAENNKSVEQLNRRRDALYEYLNKIERGEDGGAGGMDQTSLVNVLHYKKQDAAIHKDRLERALLYRVDEEGSLPKQDVVRILNESQHNVGAEVHADTIANLPNKEVLSKSDLDAVIAEGKKNIDENSLVITDADIATYGITNADLLAKAELKIEAQRVQSAAVHRTFMDATQGRLLGDPSKFRAPAVRNAADADKASADLRTKKDTQIEQEIDALEAEIKRLEESKNKLSKGLDKVGDQKTKIDEAIDAPDPKPLKGQALKDKAVELGIKPNSKQFKGKGGADRLREAVDAELAKRAETIVDSVDEAEAKLFNNVKEVEAQQAKLQSRLDMLKQAVEEQGPGARYSQKADLETLEQVEINVQSLKDQVSVGFENNEVGTISFASLAAAFNFKGSTIPDPNIEKVFGRAIVKGSDPQTIVLNHATVLEILRARIDTARQGRVDPDSSLSPQQLRLRQADEVAEWRSGRAAIRAEQHRKDGGTGINGKDRMDMTEAEYEKALREALFHRVRTRTTQKKAKHLQSQEAFNEWFDKNYLPHLDGNLVDLGNGKLDFVPPQTAALAYADTIMGRPTGRHAHKAKIEIENEETGRIDYEDGLTDFNETISHAQPADDHQIARVLMRMEYDARMEAIVKMDFDAANQPSLEQTITFLESGKIKQDEGRPLNREELALRAFWVPPQLRTGDRVGETIQQRIDRVTNELLEEDFASYDLIHDDFGTAPGDWGVSLDDIETGGYFANHGVAGGFPLARAMPNPDGSYSFGQAVLDAHAILHPQTWADTLEAQKRGRKRLEELQALEKKQNLTPEEELEISKLRAASYLRNIDGNQNGVRHAHALAMIDDAKSIDELYSIVKGRKAKGLGEKRDFYEDLARTTYGEFSTLAKTEPKAKVWLDLGVLDVDGTGKVSKDARKFAKVPVMILPYGAGKKAIRKAADDHLKKIKNADEVFAQNGVKRSEALDYLVDKWYGDQQKKRQGLIRQALDLPDAEKLLSKIMTDRQRTDPYARGMKDGNLSREEQLDMMVKRAEQIVENTKVDGEPTQNVNAVFFALQVEARAQAMMRADEITPEQASQIARRELAEEMQLMQRGDRDEINDAAKRGQMGFFENVLRILQRVEYQQADTAMTRATADQTGQAGARFSLPGEADGNMFFLQLMDWRTRMVTPRTAEADLKGRKSRRGAFDVYTMMHDAETVAFKPDSSKQQAEADLALLDKPIGDPARMTPDEWFAKHIDETRSIGSGVVDFRKRPKGMSKRQFIEQESRDLVGDDLDQALAQAGADSSIYKEGLTAKQDKLIELRIAEEKLRIKKLVVKSAMAEAAPEFSPPTRLDENGNVAQMERLTESQKMDRWEAQSEDVRRSSARAKEIYDNLKDEGERDAYRKSYGRIHDPYFDQDGNARIDDHETTMTRQEFESSGDEYKVQTARTMGGMLGARAIHPTEAIDMMVGVPAIRLADQNRTMGRQGQSIKAERPHIEAEAGNGTALKRIREGGDLFDRSERHQVYTFDREALPEIDSTSRAFDPDVLDRYEPEVQDAMIERALTRHADTYGLDKSDMGKVYAHMVWLRNVKEFGKAAKAINTKRNKLIRERSKTGANVDEIDTEIAQIESELRKKWEGMVKETNQSFDDVVNKQWDSHDIDPHKNITQVSAYGPDGELFLTKREAIIHSAEQSVGGGRGARRRAGQKTNIDLIAEESLGGDRYYEAGTDLPDPITQADTGEAFGVGYTPRRDDNAVADKDGILRTDQGFGRSRTVDYDTGRAIDLSDLDENQVLQVHYVHAKDRAGAIGSVGLREGVSRVQGLTKAGGEPYTVKEVRELMKRGKLVPGAEGNVRFFTSDGVEVIDGMMIGHNVRRNGTRNEHYWILQNSTNRFLGDRLSVSALVGRSVHKRKSVALLMDDRVSNKAQGTSLAKENLAMLGYLKRKGDPSIQQSSFKGLVMDMHKPWGDSEFRTSVLTSSLEEVKAANQRNLGLDTDTLRTAHNGVHVAEIGNLNLLISKHVEDGLDSIEVRHLVQATRLEARLKVDDEGIIRTNYSGDLEGVGKSANSQELRAFLKSRGIDPSKKGAGSEKLSLDDAREYVRMLKVRQEEFRSAIDPLSDEALMGYNATQKQAIREVAGIQMLIGDPEFVLNVDNIHLMAPHLKNMPEIDLEDTVYMAQKGVEHHRRLRKLNSVATKDGVTGLGQTPIVLRLHEDGVLDLDSMDPTNLSDADVRAIGLAWHSHEVGRVGAGLDSFLNGGEIKPETRTLYGEAVAEAQRVLNTNEPDPFGDGVSPKNYVGEFVDQNGVKRDAEYFMEAKNYRALSDAHREFDEFLESAKASGTLKLKEVRMLRAITAQLDHSILSGINTKTLEPGEFSRVGAELGLPDAVKSNARGLSYVDSKGNIGLALMKDRVGRDLTAVDVVLHEIGHVSMARLLDEGSPELTAFRSMAQHPEGKQAMRKMIMTMHGGKFTQKAAREFAYYTKRGNEDEFLAAWFSYTMMTRTMADEKAVTAAYMGGGGFGRKLYRVVKQMMSYAYRRLAQMSRIIGDLDPEYRRQMDGLMDVLTGKSEMPKLDKPREFASYRAESDGKADEIKAKEEEIDRLEGHGLDETHDLVQDAKADLDETISDALDTAVPAELDGDSLGPMTMKEALDRAVEEQYTTPDGLVDFGKMVDEDPHMAELWLATHVLPKLQEGQYTDIPNIPREMAERRQLGMGAQATHRGTFVENIILSPARASHTINSKVQLQVGDATYSIMQLAAELMDNAGFMTKARLNGNQFMTLHKVAKGLESEVVRPQHILSDELRVELAKDMGRRGGRISRSLANRDQVLSSAIQEHRQLAGALLYPKETLAYKEAKTKYDALPEGRVKELVGELRDDFDRSSSLIKRSARNTGLVGAERSKASGLMPLRLKVEYMTNKTRSDGWGPRVTDIYSKSMLESDLRDIDTLIGVGILPTPDRVRTSADVLFHLKKAAEEGHITQATYRALTTSKYLEELTDKIKSGKLQEVDKKVLPLTNKGYDLYKRGVSEGGAALTEAGKGHMNRRWQAEQTRSTSSTSPKVHNWDIASGAQLRALRLGLKVGSTSYYHGGDRFVSLSQLIDGASDMLDTDTVIGASALQRGIGLEALDGGNMSKAYGGTVKGLSVRNILKLLRKMSPVNSDDAATRSMRHGLDHLQRAYEKLSGGLPTVDQTGGIVSDGLARNATDLAMTSYGGNLGLAMLAETAVTLINDAAPRAIRNPARAATTMWRGLTEGLSPLRKTKVARQLLFGMHTARDSVSFRSFDRSVDDLASTDNRGSFLHTIASTTSKFSGAHTVQAFNKSIAAMGGFDDVIEFAPAARKLKQLLDERRGVPNKAEFKKIAKEAGFGRRWDLALEMQDAGLLDGTKLDMLDRYLSETDAKQTRILDFDEMSVKSAEFSKRKDHASTSAMDDLTSSLRAFTEDRIAKFNVEPRILDMRLVDNSGWNKVQDVFLSWPRAFFAQKSVLGGRGANLGMGHILSFYAAQATWDAMYTTFQELARGEDPDKILHEVETDPAGWLMKKASRMPLLGAYSQLQEMLVHAARDIGAKRDLGFGYHQRSMSPLDAASSPVGAVLNRALTFGQDLAGYAMSLADGTARFSTDDKQLQGLFNEATKWIPGLNNLAAQTAKGMFTQNKNNKLRGPMYYEVLQLKRAMAHERDKLRASLPSIPSI